MFVQQAILLNQLSSLQIILLNAHEFLNEIWSCQLWTLCIFKCLYKKNLFFCGFLLPFHFMWCVTVWNLTVKMYSVNLTVMFLLQWSLKIKVLQLFLQACRGVHMCIFYEPHQQGESSPCEISSCLILYSISISSDLAVWVVACHWHLDRISLMSNSCLLSLISLWGILLLNFYWIVFYLQISEFLRLEVVTAAT